jgi:hypothetical protein
METEFGKYKSKEPTIADIHFYKVTTNYARINAELMYPIFKGRYLRRHWKEGSDKYIWEISAVKDEHLYEPIENKETIAKIERVYRNIMNPGVEDIDPYGEEDWH